MIPSAEGVQQGNSIGMLLFCLTIFQMPQLTSGRVIFYVDNIIFGNELADSNQDLELVEEAGLHDTKSKPVHQCPLCTYSWIISLLGERPFRDYMPKMPPSISGNLLPLPKMIYSLHGQFQTSQPAYEVWCSSDSRISLSVQCLKYYPDALMLNFV